VRRYPAIPASLTDFMARVETCINRDETSWFLNSADYAGTGDSAYAWNEWEQMEVKWREDDGDENEVAEIRKFWDAYLPFYLDVAGDYAYFAVRITEPKPVPRWNLLAEREPRIGAVVHAVEELRSPLEVAGSFDEFLERLASTVKKGGSHGPLAGMV